MDRFVRTGPRGSAVHRALLAVLATLLACAAVALISNGARPGAPPQPGPDQGFAASGDGTSARTSAPAAPSTQSAPTRVRIPALRVNAPLTGLALEKSGRLAAPPDEARNLAGWYRAGTTPGAVGTAIVAGHVDNRKGPAVFYGLGSLKRGNTVTIDRADGRRLGFTIDAVEVYPADDFPGKKVYRRAHRPELRLITCGGGFDEKRRKYLGNVVAYAHLTRA